MRVFSLTITAGVLQLVSDDRDDNKVAARMGDGNGERDEVGTEHSCVWAICLGYCLSARRPLFPPFVRPIHTHFWPPTSHHGVRKASHAENNEHFSPF